MSPQFLELCDLGFRARRYWDCALVPVSEKKKTFLLSEPLPCSPAAETAILPLSWCSESCSSHRSSSPEECFVDRHRCY